jgi:two-component system NtrC family sensor kinase
VGSEGAQTIHVLTNIRARLEAEQDLRRERDFNQRILDNTQSVIVVLDKTGTIHYINRRGLKSGYVPDFLLGQPLVRAVHPAHQETFLQALREVAEGEPARNLELPILQKDGSAARFAIDLSSIGWGHDEMGSLIAVMTDITEASVLQSKLAHAEKMAALGRLVSGLAHEINNPLASIIGFTDLLLEDAAIPNAARDLLGLVHQESERTKTLVQNLLRFARQTPDHREPVQINHVLQQALKSRSFLVATKHLDIVENLADGLPAVPGDSNQLQQVFMNILHNAADAIKETGGTGRIEVESRAGGDMVEIRIRDTGPGVACPNHIFEPFFTTKPEGLGTGLGLSICYGIVRGHNGEILCQNNEGAAGCTFLIRLPVLSSIPSKESEVLA